MDYRSYQCSQKERLICLAASFAAAGIIAWLFYRSCYALVLVAPLYIFFINRYKREQTERRKAQLLLEFKDGMQAVSAALTAGSSMENAWRGAERELKELYGETGMMYREVNRINASVKMNEPLERGLEEFARRSGCGEIESFAEIFAFAKRSGGDFCGIINTTVQKLTGRIDVEREIATVVSGKKLEGKIMNFMPVFILAYLNLTSKEFLDMLYGNAFGVLLMSGALLAYGAAVKLSDHILDIQV